MRMWDALQRYVSHTIMRDQINSTKRLVEKRGYFEGSDTASFRFGALGGVVGKPRRVVSEVSAASGCRREQILSLWVCLGRTGLLSHLGFVALGLLVPT